MTRSFFFSAETCKWATPLKLFNQLDREDDGLLQNWSGVCWCNPPYGNRINDWLEKGFRESFNGVTSVFLLPVRSDTNWFHRWILGKSEIRFIKGRITFGDAKNAAPFPSMLVIYRAK